MNLTLVIHDTVVRLTKLFTLPAYLLTLAIADFT